MNKIEWKWTKGENYDRSKRIYKQEIDENFNKEIESSALETALNHDENTWEILNNSLFDKNFVQNNKREDTDKKMAERQMFSQISLNPYLINNNYINDIVVSNSFLKPVSTTLEKEKIENE